MGWLEALQAIYGVYQLYQSSQASKTTAHYTIPEAAKRQLNEAELLAADKKLPGQDALEAKIQENTASALKTAKELGTSGQVLSTLSRLTAGQNDAERSLGVAAAQNQLANQKNLTNELGKYAGYEDKEWQINEEQPYLVAQQKAAQLQGSGTQNIFGALSTYYGAQQAKSQYSDYLDAITGTGKYAKTTTGTNVDMTIPKISKTKFNSIPNKSYTDFFKKNAYDKINLFPDSFWDMYSGIKKPQISNILNDNLSF